MYLNAHTCYSLKHGLLQPKKLLELLAEAGHKAVAITDINNTSALLECMRLAPKYGIRVMPGVEFRNGNQHCFTIIPSSNLGYEAMSRLLSEHIMNDIPFPENCPTLPDTFVIYPFSKQFRSLAKNEFMGVAPKDVNVVGISNWANHSNKLIAFAPLTFANPDEYQLHLLLRAIEQNTILSKLDTTGCANPNEFLLNEADFKEAYSSRPELLGCVEKLSGLCNVRFDFSDEKPSGNQNTYTTSREEDVNLLKQLCKDGLAYRYPNADEKVLNRINKELEAILAQNYVSYFLINWDITSYARRKGFFYVGRGSGANSIVAYILRITDVDPIELDLYFERFINLYRKNPPDFDIDFSWRDREDITRYIFERFNHVTLLGAYVTFQFKAIVRELGKVYGLTAEDIDRLSERNLDVNTLDEVSITILKTSAKLIDLPSHIGIHAAGILITNKPIYAWCGTFMPPKGFATTQIDMVVAEDVGLHKFDILSQRGLGKIRDTLAIVQQTQPDAELHDIHDVAHFKKDTHIAEMLKNAQAIGCFYVESPAMRMLLKKLQVDNYLGLVAASSVIRPGVAKSGMMQTYIERYRNPEKRLDAHPIMLQLMPETFGVMVYQEDVIKVAHYFGGLSLGEADMLRRGMSGKYRSREEFEQVKMRFLDGAQQNGHSLELAQEVWRQTESFAGYAFAKGHSASYAVESYQSLYLKAYFPIEYMVATLNNGGGFYSRELYLHEARMHGAEIALPCINNAQFECSVKKNIIMLGFSFIKGLEDQLIFKIISSRSNGGIFDSLTHFVERVEVSQEQLSLLIRAGAFNFSGKNSRELLWEGAMLLSGGKKPQRSATLFDVETKSFSLPPLSITPLEEVFDHMELFGFPLADPFSLLEKPIRKTIYANELHTYKDKEVVVHGYLVSVKPTKTSHGQAMYFGTFTDSKGHWIDTVHFPDVAMRYPFRGKGIYQIRGKVSIDYDAVNIAVDEMHKLPFVADPRIHPMQLLRERLTDKPEF